MAVDAHPFGSQTAEIELATLDLEDFAAAAAFEVVMMMLPGGLVTVWGAREFDGDQVALFD